MSGVKAVTVFCVKRLHTFNMQGKMPPISKCHI